jgi:CheY-like chemotaxis protein
MSKILIVDDSRVERDAFARILQGIGHSVSTAASGRIAWMMLYANLPDLIVLDLVMPEMSGLVFLRMLRSHHHWKELPVLVLTGLEHDEAIVEEVRTAGVVDVIHKGSDSVAPLLRRIAELFPQNSESIGCL